MTVITKGNVIVEDIKIGDIHYEFEYGVGIKCEVITLPVRDEDGIWSWKSRNVNTNKEIDYAINENVPSCYTVNLYNYEAYSVKIWI